jgi:hypothetical protein
MMYAFSASHQTLRSRIVAWSVDVSLTLLYAAPGPYQGQLRLYAVLLC